MLNFKNGLSVLDMPIVILNTKEFSLCLYDENILIDVVNGVRHLNYNEG